MLEIEEEREGNGQNRKCDEGRGRERKGEKQID